jgi:hypothetical protein
MDGQIHTLDEIERLRRTRKQLEREKTPPARTTVKIGLEVKL